MTKNDKNELSKYFSYFQINSQKSKYSLGYVAFDDPQSTLKSALQILNISYNFVDVLLIMVSQQSSSCSRLPKVVRSLVISRLYYSGTVTTRLSQKFLSCVRGAKKGRGRNFILVKITGSKYQTDSCTTFHHTIRCLHKMSNQYCNSLSLGYVVLCIWLIRLIDQEANLFFPSSVAWAS